MLKMKKHIYNWTQYYDAVREKYIVEITDPQGKRLKKRFDDETNAETWKAQLITAFNNHTYIAPSGLTVGAWIAEWLSTYSKPNVRLTSYIRYKQSAAYLDPIANIKLQELNAAHIQKLLNTLPDSMASSSKNKVYKVLAQALKKALMLDLIYKDPCMAVEAPKIKNHEVQIFSHNDMRKILGKLSMKSKVQPLLIKRYPMILLAATTGMRIGEILGLHWADIDFKLGIVKVRRTLNLVNGRFYEEPPKTAAGRRNIPIPDETLAELKTLWQKENVMAIDGTGYVFHTRNGTPVAKNNVNKFWHSILALCEVPYKNIHVLRHTHATELLAAGVPLIEVSRRLGHADASITLKVYGHAIPGYGKETLEKIKEVYAL